MNTVEIKSVTDYLLHINSFEQQHIAQWIYRGVRNSSYSLIPSLFRISIKDTLTNWEDLEEYMLSVFRRECKPYLEGKSLNDLELLTLAQHHGLPTRLLDWSTNPLVALFFSVETFGEAVDSGVWCFGYPSTHNCFPESTRIDTRMSVELDKGILFPNHISQRITNQSGCFTVNELPARQDPFVPWEQQSNLFGLLEKIVVRKEHKKNIINQLYDLGYHHGLIYPGLEGLSKRISFEVATTHNRCSNPDQQTRFRNQFDPRKYF